MVDHLTLDQVVESSNLSASAVLRVTSDMKPNLYRQYLVDKLKVMRSTGEPVWIDWQGLQLKLRPETENDYYEGGQAVLIKVRSRLHVVILTNHDGFWVYERGGCQPPRKIQTDSVMAVITEPSRDVLYDKLATQRVWKRKHLQA